MTTDTLASQVLALSRIRIDGDTQARLDIDADTVEEYAERMLAGKAFPPLTVCHDGKVCWLVDGFHRFHAARTAGLLEFPCEVHQGTLDEARWLSLTTNAEHGRPRTNADKRHYVELALDRRPELSDKAIAEHVGVSQPFVSKVRKERDTYNGYTSTIRIGRDGRTIETANIGRVDAGKILTLTLDTIRVERGLHAREKINDDTVEYFADMLADGCKDMPPLGVCHDGQSYWLYDGFHRYHAAKKAGLATFPCRVTSGSREDAVWMAVAANQGPRSLIRNAMDRRRSVELILRTASEWSDRAIADHLVVSPALVASVRSSL